MKATQLLRMHHQDLEQRFDRLEGAGTSERTARRDDVAAILVGHSVIERELFYPACASAAGFDDEIRQALEEHAIVEWTLQRLLASNVNDPSFLAKVVVLRDIVKRHVDDEEDEILPEAERIFDDAKLEAMGSEMALRFERAKASWDRELARAIGVTAASVRAKAPARATASRERAAAGKTARAVGVKRAATAKRGASARTQAAPSARGARKTTGAKTKSTRKVSRKTSRGRGATR
jgi:hypothetical protein